MSFTALFKLHIKQNYTLTNVPMPVGKWSKKNLKMHCLSLPYIYTVNSQGQLHKSNYYIWRHNLMVMHSMPLTIECLLIKTTDQHILNPQFKGQVLATQGFKGWHTKVLWDGQHHNVDQLGPKVQHICTSPGTTPNPQGHQPDSRRSTHSHSSHTRQTPTTLRGARRGVAEMATHHPPTSLVILTIFYLSSSRFSFTTAQFFLQPGLDLKLFKVSVIYT